MQFFETALFFAAKGGNTAITSLLLKNGANTDVQETQVGAVTNI